MAMREAISAAVARAGAPLFSRIYRYDRALRRKLMPAGWILAATLVVSATFGLNTQDTLIYQVFALSTGLLVVAALASLRLGIKARVTRSLPLVASAGVEFTYKLTLHNDSRKPIDRIVVDEVLEAKRPTVREFVRFKVHEDRTRNLFDRLVGYPRWVSLMRWRAGATIPRVEIARVEPHASAAVTMRCKPLRRGEIRFESVVLGRPEPLGFLRSLWRRRAGESVLVMPRTYPVAHVQLPGRRRLQPRGVAFAGRVGDAEEFVSLREYRAGDTPRRIHWKAWARTGRPVVKEYQDEFFVRHALLLDTFDSHDATQFESAVSLASSLVMMPRSNDSLLDLMFVEDRAYTLTQGRGLGTPLDLLRVLATVQPSQGRFGALEEAALLNAARISSAICVLLDWDEPRRTFVGRLRSRGVAVRTWIVRADDDPLLEDLGPMASDARNFRVVTPQGLAEALLEP